MTAAPAGFEVVSSAIPLPEILPFQSLAELMLRDRAGCDPSAPILLGTIGEESIEVGVGQLRSLILELADAFDAHFFPSPFEPATERTCRE